MADRVTTFKIFAGRALFDDVSLEVNRGRLDLRSFSSRRTSWERKWSRVYDATSFFMN